MDVLFNIFVAVVCAIGIVMAIMGLFFSAVWFTEGMSRKHHKRIFMSVTIFLLCMVLLSLLIYLLTLI